MCDESGDARENERQRVVATECGQEWEVVVDVSVIVRATMAN